MKTRFKRTSERGLFCPVLAVSCFTLAIAGCSGGEEGLGPASGGTSSAGGSFGSGSSSALGTGGGTGPVQGTGGASQTNEPPRWSVEGVTPWRYDATAAYTIFHDDLCDPVVDNQFSLADAELTKRGLVASFGAIAMYCQDRSLWDELETIRSHGHEIVNHSWSHENLTEMSVDLVQEMDAAKSAFIGNLIDFEMTFFIFPYDAFSPTLVQRLKDDGYLGTRAGDRGLNGATFDDFGVKFDVYGPGYSIYVGQGPCSAVSEGDGWSTASEACREYILEQYVVETVAAGGWGVRELHSLNGEAWEPVPLALYQKHLDSVQSKAASGQLWVGTASDVIRYVHARQNCPLPTVSGDELRFAEPTGECARYQTGLTYRIRPLSGSPALSGGTQGVAALVIKSEAGGSYLVTAQPGAGPAVLTVTP